MTEISQRRKHLAIALVSAAIILLQIAVTRILSVMLWYHWAFFSISLAMLGVGAPGVWFTFSKKGLELLPRLLVAASLLLPLGVAAMIQLQHHFGGWAIVFCMFCLLPGVLSLGACVCLLLLAAPGAAVGRMYAFDLLGACAGALLVVPLMSLLPTPQLAAGAGLLPLVAYALVVARGKRPVALVLGLALVGSLLWTKPYEVKRTKEYAEAGPALTPIFLKWTPTARLAVFKSIPWAPDVAFRWGVSAKPGSSPAPKQYWLEQDGSAGTPITQFSGDWSKLDYLLSDVTAVGYQLRGPKRVAVVGAGGGRDVLTARLAGADRIDAIELNAGIVEAMRGPFAKFSGGVYDLKGVEAIVGEGRSVLTASKGGYDLIQISMIDSWAATAAGAYALSENNLYTLEAYRLYFSRLSDNGLVSTSRWMNPRFGFEVPRLLLMVFAALEAEKVAAPREHIALAQAGTVATVLMSRSPLTAVDKKRLAEVCKQRGFVLHFPHLGAKPAAKHWVDGLLDNSAEAVAVKSLRLTPPTDDKPFFFQMLSPFDFSPPEFVERMGFNAQGVSALRKLMVAMTVVTLLLFFAPFALRRWLPRPAGFWQGSAFFCCIGLGFMLVEIAWLQRFVLYLGHPSLATTAALGCMLLGAGIGAMLSSRLGMARATRWGLSVAATTGVVSTAMSLMFTTTLGWPLPLRVLLTAVLLVPCGLLMGLMFPLGMRRFGEEAKAWYWALNGAASVLASVVSLALAMEIGFLKVAYLGSAMYVLAAVLLVAGGSPEGEPACDAS